MTRTVELPEDLIRRAEELAAGEQLSVEEFLSAQLSEQLSGLEYLKTRAARASRAKFEAALQHIPDVEPDEYDRL